MSRSLKKTVISAELNEELQAMTQSILQKYTFNDIDTKLQ